MKKNILIQIFFVFCVLTFANKANSQKNLDNLENKLTNVLDSVYSASKVPGITVGVWTKDFTYKKSVGKADLLTGTDRKFDDKIRIGSISKTFVATVILQLVDEGRINLDDPLSKYYPDYPDSENITIRQMLDMTSGIPDYIEDPVVLKSFVYDRTDIYTLEQLYEITKKMKPSFPPGTGWEYSNGNYNILGMMIEKVTGNKIQDEINYRILEPLKLYNTSYPTTAFMEGQYSHGYMKDTVTGELVDVTTIDPSITWAAGCMISDIDDLKIYSVALATGTMLSKTTQEERLKFINPGTNPFIKYGLGIFSLEGFIGHNGGITGYNTTMCYNPALDAIIIVSVNEYGVDGGISDRIFTEIAQTIFPDKNLFKK